jgi:type IV secretion system protein VirB9
MMSFLFLPLPVFPDLYRKLRDDRIMISFLLLPLLLSSCATVDMEERVRETGTRGGVSESPPPPHVAPVEIPRTLVVEKPVYVPYEEKQPPAADEPAGRDAVKASNKDGIMEPREYSRAAMVYDYDPDWVYELYTRPLRASDICLQPGEKALETPFISDSERWLLGAGVSIQDGAQVQHIYVKPTEPALEASLIINTDRRVYHLILRSFRDVHMPMVRWRYPASGMPNNYAAPVSPPAEAAGIDPRFLSFNYRMIYTLFGRPSWLPELVYDDGAKTYISFPQNVLQRGLPAVFEKRGNLINYRVAGNLIIIDKLIEDLTVELEGEEISIEKKRG